MALSGSGGAYYRGNGTIPSTAGLHSNYTRHMLVKSSISPSTSNFRILGGHVGSGQNPQEFLTWNHTTAAYSRANQHRASSGAYTPIQFASPSTGAWHAMGCTFGGGVFKGYVDGIVDGSTTGLPNSSSRDVEIQLLGAMTFGGSLDASSQCAEFEVAEYAYWNVALSADEMASLAKGIKAFRIRPQNLVFYAPCIRGLQDMKGGRTLVKQAGTDTPVSHPPVR